MLPHLPFCTDEDRLSEHKAAKELLQALVLALAVLFVCYSVLRKIPGFMYLIKGPSIIDAGYYAQNRNAFLVPTPSNNLLLVSSPEQIKEYTDAPASKLSLHAAAKEFLQPKYTMYGFEWKDQRGAEGIGFVRALRSLMTANLPHFLPILSSTIETQLASSIEKGMVADGKSHVKFHSMIKRLVTKANCIVFFGEELAYNDEFAAAALRFPEDVLLAGEIIRMTPRILAPIVASLITKRHRSAKTLFRYLAPIVEARLEEKRKELKELPVGPKPIDCVQWLIDTAPQQEHKQWTVARTVWEIIAVWFSSVHQVAMTATFLIHDFCTQIELVDGIRAELRNASPIVLGNEPHECVFPLLDSFIQESMRAHTSDAVTGRRKVLEPFYFSDGLCARPGDWICVPQKALLSDARHFEEPSLFDPTRFLNKTRLTDATYPWVVWGCGKFICPGRFYASAVLKLIAFHILRKYRCELKDEKASRTFVWRSAIVPRESTVVVFEKLVTV